MDPKTSLQEIAAALGLGVPAYVLSGSGPDHSKRFTASVVLGDETVATGEGSSKKHAEMAAALIAWNSLQAGAEAPDAATPSSAQPETS
jgi:ribonuclease-3